VVGSLKFYEREEIKDALALLSFLVNPRDEVAFRRVVNKPSRGLGPAAVNRIVEAAGVSLAADASLAPDGPDLPGDLGAAAKKAAPELSARARAGIESFLTMIEEGRALLAPGSGGPELGAPAADVAAPGARGTNAGDVTTAVTGGAKKRKVKTDRETLVSGEKLSVLVVKLIQDSGIGEYHQSRDDVSGNQRLGNLQELANAASLYDPSIGGLLEFLEHIELDRALEDASGAKGSEEGAVTLITFHNTKGLEFRRVIMTGIEQGVFPREDKKDEELEEERRLFYVGATRAMDELYLTSCAMRRMYGRTVSSEPSVFLREIDRDCLRIIGKAPWGFAAPARRPAGNGGFGGGTGWGDGDRRDDGEDRDWRRGDRLYHDDYGYGAVVEVRDSEEGPVVRAQFETGKDIRFLSRHQGSRFTRIGDDG
jgi:DNA helicase-2/ATP-dependent DNA helicase PcrA